MKGLGYRQCICKLGLQEEIGNGDDFINNKGRAESNTYIYIHTDTVTDVCVVYV